MFSVRYVPKLVPKFTSVVKSDVGAVKITQCSMHELYCQLKLEEAWIKVMLQKKIITKAAYLSSSKLKTLEL